MSSVSEIEVTIEAGHMGTLPEGAHDDFLLTLSCVKDKFDSSPATTNCSLRELKAHLIEDASTPQANKDDLYGVMPCSWQEGAPSKEEIYAQNRHMLMLDFDQKPDLDWIRSRLADIVYFGWTTHSHQTAAKEYGNRYRFLIPFVESPDLTQWKKHYRLRLEEWIERNDFGTRVNRTFMGDNAVDASCLTFGQIGFMPAMNPEVGVVKLFFNDHANTRIFSLDNDLPELSAEDIAARLPDTTYTLLDWRPETKELGFLIDILSQKNELAAIDANPTGNNGVNRKTIAAALQSIGGGFNDFVRLDSIMKKAGSNTSTRKAWDDAMALKAKHPGVFFKFLSRAERRLCGLSRDEDIEVAAVNGKEFDRTEVVDYLSRASYGTAKRVLVKADMGTGKNYTWAQHWNTGDDRVIVLAPLRTIVGQQGSDNRLEDHTNSTFTYDQSKKAVELIQNKVVDPEKTTLVIDECHNLILARFRLEALANVERLLAYPFKQIIFQSATIDADSFDGFFEFDERLCYRKRGAPKLTYTSLNVGGMYNQIAALEKVIKEGIYNGGKVLCLWNNKNKLDLITKRLRDTGLAAEVISAERTKLTGTEAHRLANDADYTMGELQVMFGTTSLVEGVSIKDDINVGRVIIVGNEPPQYIKQMCGRFRNAKKIECWHIGLSEKEEAIPDVNEWLDQKRQDQIIRRDYAKFLATTVSNYDYCGHAAMLRSQSIARAAHDMAQESGFIFDEETNSYRFSTLNHLFLKAELDQIEFYSNRDYGTQVMRRMGFSPLWLPKGSKWTAEEDDKEMIKALTQQVTAKQRLKRQWEAAPVIEAVQGLMPYGDGIEFWAVEAILRADGAEFGTFDHSFSEQVRDASRALFSRGAKGDEVLDMIKKLVDKKTSANAEVLKVDSEGAKEAIYSKLKGKYPAGTALTQDQQRGVLSEIIQHRIDEIKKVRPLFDSAQAFERVMDEAAWKRAYKSGQIQLNNNQVEVSIPQPFKPLSEWIRMSDERRRIGGKQSKVGVIL